ncbi:MAG: YqiA/YcfP family alpha/beta fold hydrolase, partial [Vicinamibacterales bacterium]
MTRPKVTPVRHVIYLHGFASSPESSKAIRFRRELEVRGVGFSCPDFNQPAFETLTTTRMLGQVHEALADVAQGPIALVGSSLGAFVAVHVAARETTAPIDRLILLAPALDFGGNRLRQLGPAGIEDWRRSGSLRVFHYGAGVERKIGFELYEDAAQYDALTLPTLLPALVFQGAEDTSVDPVMVQHWAEGRTLVDLRVLSDDHQLTSSMDLIWRESAPFLGLAGAT